MKFHKYHGAGNDFIILNNMDLSINEADYPRLAAVLCRRHMSVGADGLMAVEPSGIADYRMRFYNSDGSAGEMCGNGARCICRYGYEMGLAGETQRVETASGIVVGQRLEKRIYRVQLTDPTLIELHRTVTVNGTDYDCAYIELGNPGLPHAVIRVPGLADMPLDDIRGLGCALRHYAEFPKGANANLYDLEGADRAVLRTFERGVEDFTFACGTGSAATALTIADGDSADRSVSLRQMGGTVTVDIHHTAGGIELYLAGPTSIIAEGEILDEDL